MTIKHRYAELSLQDKKLIFYSWLLLISTIIWWIVGYANTSLDNLFSNYSIVINDITINKSAVLIAPVLEECMKLLGYGLIFLVDFNRLFHLEYKSKKDFIDNNLALVFLVSVGAFGILEGIVHNRDYYLPCVLAFVCLNTLAHITYSAYPLFFGRRHKNCFVCFLPVAMLLHSVHNYIITAVWDNKWVTFTIVTIFLIPLLILERDNLYKIVKRIFPKITKNILSVIFVAIYTYIFLCCLLAF